MFINKNKYFLLIETIKDIDLKNIKIRNKFSIIYRCRNNTENRQDLLKFRKKCKLKAIKFYIANDTYLAVFLNADGIYLSAFNNSLKNLSLIRSNFHIIGSAHNLKEITIKFPLYPNISFSSIMTKYCLTSSVLLGQIRIEMIQVSLQFLR